MEHRTDPGRGEHTAAARDEASRVKDEAQHEVGRVKDEATRQGRQLYEEARQRVESEADQRTHQAAEGLRSFSSDLRSMADGSDTRTPAATWAQQGAGRLETFADRLESRGFEGLTSDVSRFARRNPGTFLAAALGAGLVVGRVMKNMGSDDGDGAVGAGAGRTQQAVVPSAAPNTEPLSDKAVGQDPLGASEDLGVSRPGTPR